MGCCLARSLDLRINFRSIRNRYSDLLIPIAVPKVGTATASILSAMELPVAVTVSVLLLSESLSFLQVIGIIIILIGMTLPTYIQRRKNNKIIGEQKGSD